MTVNSSPSVPQSEAANILSKLLNQSIHGHPLNPLMAYLAALSAVLVGVIHADSQVTEEETQRLKKILTQFIPKDSSFDLAVRSLMKGVRDSKIYAKPVEIGTLISSYAESEKLLLIGLGYELATADNDLNPKEQKYLHIVAQQLSLKAEWLDAIEGGLLHQRVSNAIGEVRYLLDPARFQGLDPVFARAANQILMQLPDNPKNQGTGVQIDYETLMAFQAQRQQLHHVCEELQQAISNCQDSVLVPEHLATDLQLIAHRLQSHQFRVAVVGEFSQGKSTLLNALLGEEIQPTRVIPCSGSITVLRYGEQKRIICRYRSGREEIIPLEEYQVRAAIPEEMALSNRADALTSEVSELVYEHPGLELCRHGVELIDSPGLNEHPERTRITQQLLDDVDAVIFLANGSRPMTQGERELLESLRAHLTQGQDNLPANNLFVLVNFMDLVRRDRDRQQVKQLVENFVLGEAPIIEAHRQLHFISAQAALDAIIDGDEQDEYLQAFRGFTQELQIFLTQTRGEIVNQRIKTGLHNVIQALTLQLSQTEAVMKGEVTISSTTKQNILNQMGEVSGYLANLQTLIEETRQKKREQVKSLEINPYLEEFIRQESASWCSIKNEKNKIIREFFDEFQSALSEAIDVGQQTIIMDELLTPSLNEIDSHIQNKVYQFRKSAEEIDLATGSQLANQLTVGIHQVAPQFQFNAGDSDNRHTFFNAGIGGIGGLGGGGLLAGGIALAVSSMAFFPVVLTTGAIAGIAAGGAALGTAIGGALGFFAPPDQEAIKQEVIESGLKQFYEQNGPGQLMDALDALVISLFDQRLLAIQAVTRKYMALLNTLLVDAEAAHTSTLNNLEIASQWYETQHSRLNKLQDQLHRLLA